MDRLFSEAPLFIGSRDMSGFKSEIGELAQDINEKQHTSADFQMESVDTMKRE